MRNFLNGISPVGLCAPEGVGGAAVSTPAPKTRTAKPCKPQFAASLELGDRLIREEECFRLTGLSRTTRWRLERKGRFPARRELSDNGIGWLLSEVLAWRDSRPLALTVSETA